MAKPHDDKPKAPPPPAVTTTAERRGIDLAPRQCPWCLTPNADHKLAKCVGCHRPLKES